MIENGLDMVRAELENGNVFVVVGELSNNDVETALWLFVKAEVERSKTRQEVERSFMLISTAEV